jgi:hypothetical protein
MLVVPSADADGVQPVVDRLRAERRTIVSLRPVRESLEDLFMRFVHDPETGRAKPPGAARSAPPPVPSKTIAGEGGAA